MKEFFEKNKKKVVVLILSALMFGASILLGVEVDISSVFQGDLSTIGEKLEAAPE